MGIIPADVTDQQIIIDVEEGPPVSVVETQNSKELRCKHCGTTLNQCKLNGYLNCDVCYETFNSFVLDNLRRITGEKPKEEPEKTKPVRSVEDQISNLTVLMNSAISREDYEEAASFRDKIKEFNEIKSEIINYRNLLEVSIKNDDFDEAKKIKKKIDVLNKTLASKA